MCIRGQGLVVLEKYSDLPLKNKVETVAIEKIEEILNNPVSWYPDYDNYVISLTQKGEKLLEDLDSQSLQKLKKRLFTKSK